MREEEEEEEEEKKKRRKKESQAKKVWMLAFGMELVIFIWNYMVLYGFLV